MIGERCKNTSQRGTTYVTAWQGIPLKRFVVGGFSGLKKVHFCIRLDTIGYNAFSALFHQRKKAREKGKKTAKQTKAAPS